jgi:hypothetical protein
MTEQASVVSMIQHYLGEPNLASPRIQRLQAADIDTTKFAELYRDWLSSFRLSALPSGNVRPYLLSGYGEHAVRVEDHGPYDPYMVFNSGPLSLRELLNSHPSQDVTPAIVEIIKRITLHGLYAHSVAIEYPWSGDIIAMNREWVLKFIKLATALLPALEAGLVHLTPTLDDLGLRDSARNGPSRDALTEAIALLGGRVTNFYHSADDFDLDAARDPLGDLDGNYASALHAVQHNGYYGVNEQSLRGKRAANLLTPLMLGMEASTRFSEVDPFMTRRELVLIRRIIDRTNWILRESPSHRRRVDDLLAFSPLLDLQVPTGRLTLPDLVALRRGGEFTAFREGLRRGLVNAQNQAFDEHIDPRSVKMAEIRHQIEEARRSIGRDVGRSRWLRTRLGDTGEILLATAAGVAGSYAAGPALAAVAGVGTYAATRLLEWIKGRVEEEGQAFARHLAIFDDRS